MIKCEFENDKQALLRHVTLNAIVIDGNKILLIKRAAKSLTEPNKYALPGVYLDRNESPTEGVMRELLEETGYQAKVATLFRVVGNPNREGSDRQDVDFSFIVEAGEKVAESDDEVSEVKWFEIDNLPEIQEFAFDHYETIQLYLDYLKQKFNLPVLDI